MKDRFWLLAAPLLFVAAVVNAQEKKDDDKKSEPKEHPAHQELREVRDGMKAAFNKKDLDALLKYVHKDCVVTWQNAVVSRGHKGIKEYYDDMLTGPNSKLEGVTASPELEKNSVLYGDPPTTAVAVGDLNDEYTLRGGTVIKMKSRFSVTLVKEDGKWLIVNFHGSTNVFGNAVMDAAIKQTMWMTAGAVGLAALLIGLIVGRLMGGKKA